MFCLPWHVVLYAVNICCPSVVLGKHQLNPSCDFIPITSAVSADCESLVALRYLLGAWVHPVHTAVALQDVWLQAALHVLHD